VGTWARVLGSETAYVEVGEGDSIVLLHGNPTRRTSGATCCRTWSHEAAASPPDLIGMGDCDKLPDSGPGSYRFVP
jgi:haloalkane dehalogenase